MQKKTVKPSFCGHFPPVPKLTPKSQMGLQTIPKRETGSNQSQSQVSWVLRAAMVCCVNPKFLMSITIDGIKGQETTVVIMLKSMSTK